MENKKNGFEAGQPINTEDSMNDMPTFEDKVRENIPEAIEFLNQRPELKAGIGRAAAKLEELNKMLEEGNLEGAEEKNSAFVSAVEAFNATVRANEKLKSKLEDHEIRKLDGEYSEEEYKQAVEETKGQFKNADNKLVEADTTLEYADAVKAIEDAKTKIANLEMAKDEVQISEEEYNTGMAAAKQELADAEARAREAQAVMTANNANGEDIKSEADKKLEDLEIRKLDGDLSEEEYKQAVEEIKNNADKDAANIEASNAVAEAVQARKLAEGKIAIAEKQLDDLDTRHLDGDISEDEFKSESERLNKIIEESKKIIEDANSQIENSNFEASDVKPEPAAAEAAPAQGGVDAAAAEATSEENNATLEAWRAKQDALENDINAKFSENIDAENAKLNNAKADLEANKTKLEELIAAGASEESLAKLKEAIAQNEQDIADGEERIAELNNEHEHQLGNDRGKEGLLEDIDVDDGAEAAGTGDAEKDSESEFEEFKESYLSDPDWRAIYTRNGAFNEEACVAAIRNIFEAKKKADAEQEAELEKNRAKEVSEILDEDKEAEAEKAEDGFETAEQRGLFAKLKNFFNKNKRSKAGAERAIKKGGLTGWKKFAYAGLLALVVGISGANIMQGAMPSKAPDVAQPTMTYAAEVATPEDETKDDTVDVKTVAEDLSLKVDLNAENKGEAVPDSVMTTAYGEDIEVDISYDDYDGTTEFLDYSEKHGEHNLTKPLYEMENENLTDAQRAEQIAEGLADVLDDPIEQGQFAGLGGADVHIDGKTNGITNLDDMNEVLDLAQQDDEFRKSLADYNKEMYRDLVDNHDLKLEHRDKGSFHYSLYAYETKLEDGTSDISYKVDKNGVVAQEAFDALQFMDADGNNVLDSNEIGGYKYNFLKAVGIIGEDDTDEVAQEKMSKIRIIGFSGKCGQLIWENVKPDTGSESTGNEPTGNEPTGSEPTGSEPTGSEPTGSEPTGSEPTGSEPTGSEPTGSEPTGSEPTGSEPTGAEPTGAEPTGAEPTGAEPTGAEPTGAEPTGVEPTGAEPTGVEPTGVEPTGEEPTGDELKPKTEETVASDDWDQQDVTDYDEATRGEPVVTEADTGKIDEQAPGTSSDVADENFLNGGDTGGGTGDADGGGSTNPETEATYNPSDTSGYDNGASQETGTQTISEPTPEETYENNNSEANEESRPTESVEDGDSSAPSNEEKANMMDDMF